MSVRPNKDETIKQQQSLIARLLRERQQLRATIEDLEGSISWNRNCYLNDLAEAYGDG